ncbi:NADH-ubiquinone oxidoreductase 21 kDa subunit [Wickerhamomyces ciferrii]|uniref:NADH-ubiquinone oxidoreductase 21 kDa subunit n=1 Tax=Wickerhamomyces ciferrii (strain ATCC 14091 / BCRC 22168 / CBS 111 / JCM 3599 / NBRC 0793 / NRRL Y-1031 F-60-10) TaxID=1206466 RepID=K0KKI3_WICCF|nr:NADH-ubiquinone oxidoreductase 21 kDa subunit [Wickerhamomyces ciferrii]CCH42667.1 NADH-ubiquinone oxidoreductase 21 kDa subunit [Wickerhamomyces ciferrii]
MPVTDKYEVNYGTWAIATAAFPGLFTALEYFDPNNGKHFTRPNGGILRVTTIMGFIGGFIIVYNHSTKRFWGVSENSREVKLDRYEIKSKLSKGEFPYGTSTLTPNLQDVAARNSKNSQLFLGIIPWFNLVSHPHHDVDLKKYYEVRPGEEEWGFKLPEHEELKRLSSTANWSGV